MKVYNFLDKINEVYKCIENKCFYAALCKYLCDGAYKFYMESNFYIRECLDNNYNFNNLFL